jgi:2-phospho-L-lactate guanylyltransferase
MPETPSMLRVVLVPLKNFTDAKSRLREVLSEHEVEALTLHLAQTVLEAVKPLHTLVVCDDDEVANFAIACGAGVLRTASTTLNGALSEAYQQMGRFDQVLIVHGDLRRPQGLGSFQPGPGVTIVTDHHQLGTNVMSLPTGLDFRFSYGANSAQLHQREAERLGITWRVTTDSPWRFDVDEPDDLESSPDNI